MWSDSPKVKEFPHHGDTFNYFPTITSVKEVEFERIFTDKDSFEKEILLQDIMLGVTHLTINDEPIYLFDQSRKTSFVNSVKERKWTDYKSSINQVKDVEQPDRDIIKMFTLQQGNINTQAERKITTMFDESGTIGGMANTLVFLCQVVYWFFGAPFRQLNLAYYYQKLREGIQIDKRY